MKFLKIVFATILGFFISIFMMLFFFIVLITAVAGSVEGYDMVNIKSNSVLKLSTHDAISDYNNPIKFEGVELNFDKNKTLKEYTDAIKFAASDDNIKGIMMDTYLPVRGITKVKAIRDAIKIFKKSGKFVYAYSDNITQIDYYLKSVADSIFLNPLGGLDFRGLYTEVLYFKDFQDKSGVNATVVRHGKYKSAVEPYLSNKMSEPNREQISSFLKSIWSSIVGEISESRNISKETLNIIAKDFAARNTKLALRNKMIDGAIYSDQFESIVKKRLGVTEHDEINTIDLDDYTDFMSRKSKLKDKSSDKIAVIYAVGTILYGQDNRPDIISQEPMIKSIRKAIKDDEVKGIVLRVNSPGGDALTSDIIWHELKEAKKKKPVYVSMGDVAASGGYYISCGADRIFAEETTITGSIGVFGVLPNVKKLIDKIGINAEQVVTHKNAQLYSLFEPLSKNSRAFIQEMIETIYETFVNRVSEGRGMPFSQADSIAQGRVWSGLEAKENGLVDEIGGLDATIDGLAEKLNLKNYSIRNYPEFEFDVDDFLSKFMMRVGLFKEISESDSYKKIKALLDLRRRTGIQARLPYEFTLE